MKSAVRARLVHALAAAARAEGRHQDAEKAEAAGAPRWSGTVAYRALFAAEGLRRRVPGHRVLEEPVLVSFWLGLWFWGFGGGGGLWFARVLMLTLFVIAVPWEKFCMWLSALSGFTCVCVCEPDA